MKQLTAIFLTIFCRTFDHPLMPKAELLEKQAYASAGDIHVCQYLGGGLWRYCEVIPDTVDARKQYKIFRQYKTATLHNA